MSHSPWVYAALVLIFITLWMDIGKEEFEPSPRVLTMRLFDDLPKRNVHVTEGSIVSVRLEDVRIGKPEKQGMVTQMVQGKKAFMCRASATPKLILSKGSIIIDKRMHIEVQGETRGETVASAKDAINEIGTALAAEAKFRGLLA
jgi:hypothetical protein